MSDDAAISKRSRGMWPPGVSGNVGGRPKSIRELRELIQEHGREIVEQQIAIATGTATTQVIVGENVIDVAPSFRDRTAAAALVLAYGIGKPTDAPKDEPGEQAPTKKRLDLSRLSAEDLQKLHAIAVKAKGDEE